MCHATTTHQISNPSYLSGSRTPNHHRSRSIVPMKLHSPQSNGIRTPSRHPSLDRRLPKAPPLNHATMPPLPPPINHLLGWRQVTTTGNNPGQKASLKPQPNANPTKQLSWHRFEATEAQLARRRSPMAPDPLLTKLPMSSKGGLAQALAGKR